MDVYGNKLTGDNDNTDTLLCWHHGGELAILCELQKINVYFLFRLKAESRIEEGNHIPTHLTLCVVYRYSYLSEELPSPPHSRGAPNMRISVDKNITSKTPFTTRHTMTS